jgi:hypothetical protein
MGFSYNFIMCSRWEEFQDPQPIDCILIIYESYLDPMLQMVPSVIHTSRSPPNTIETIKSAHKLDKTLEDEC